MLLSKALSPLILLASMLGTYAKSSPVKPIGSQRNLQTTVGDPCEGMVDENVLWPTPDIMLYVPSFYEGCIQSLDLNATHVLEHLYSLNGTFAEYYAFYHITKDPAVSFPGTYQPELGYSLFDSEYEGKVDLVTRTDDLYSDIFYNGANASVFWSISDIFKDLRDAHVGSPQLNEEFGGVLSYGIGLVPESILNNEFSGVQPHFSLLDDGTLELSLSWLSSADASTSERTVETMGELSVTDFIHWIAYSRCSGPYQTVGARLNALLKDSNFAPRTPFFMPFYLWCTTKPSDLLPDTIEVTYSDGGQETWHTSVYGPSLQDFLKTDSLETDSYFIFNRSGLEEILTHPGKARTHYDDMMSKEIKAWDFAFADNRAADAQTKSLPVEIHGIKAKQNGGGLSFQSCASCISADGTVLAEFFVGEDYAVLKIESFVLAPHQAVDIWTSLVAVAKEKDVKKLMIDLSGNGGGIIQGGMALMMLMFPRVSYEWFDGHADMTYNNQMRAYLENILPVVDGLEARIEAFTDEDIETLVEALSDETPSLVILSASLFLFCKDSCELDPKFTSSVECACPAHWGLFSIANTLFEAWKVSTPAEEAVPIFRNILSNLTHFVKEVNPWTVTQGGGIVLASGQESVKKSVIRGGEQYYLTEDFAFLPESCDNTYLYGCHVDIQDAALDLDFQFDEYILVSDGVAGSTTAIFAAGVEQIWKNRDRSFANSSVVTVAYGGTGYPDDITLAGFPASVQHVRIENPLLTRGAVTMLRILLSDYLNLEENAGFSDLLVNAHDAYIDTLTVPPYFSDSLPYIPVINYYDAFMGPDAVPLQYVKMPPDEYIPRLFTSVSFDESSDLPALYKEASAFFTNTGGAAVSKGIPAAKSAQENDLDKSEASMTFEDSLAEAFHSGQAVSLVERGFASLTVIATFCFLLA